MEHALRLITNNQKRCVFVVSSDGRLIGSLTDGDFRRWLTAAEEATLSAPCSKVANRACITLQQEAPRENQGALFGDGVDLIPVIDLKGHVVGIAARRGLDFNVGPRKVGPIEPVFVIAEIGLNHNGNLETALRLVDAAAQAGADCAKFQMRNMETAYRTSKDGLAGEDLGAQYTLDLLRENVLTNDDLFTAFDYAAAAGIIPLCTAWDLHSARALFDYGVLGFKVASADLTNHELVTWLGETGRPLIVSTGMSTEVEIKETVDLLQSSNSPYALLQCTSSYPTSYRDVNLRYMNRLHEIGNCTVGYSGHERGFHIPLAAVALGAKIVEKHITLDRAGRGNDHVVSLEPDDFGRMVRQIRETEAALGSRDARTIGQGEALNRLSLAKSLVARCDLPAGATITDGDIEIRGPGRGLQPNRRAQLVGVTLTRSLSQGDFFYPTDLGSSLTSSRKYSFDRPWGLPVRFHDWRDLYGQTNAKFLEFHLSYRDLDVNLDHAVPEGLPLGLVVHSPDLFLGDLILDLAADDDRTRIGSIDALQRVADLTRRLRGKFICEGATLIVVSMGGSTLDFPVPKSERGRLYTRVLESLDRIDSTDVEFVAQTLPPYPWYLGGQRHCNLFVDPIETASFAEESGLRLCLDVAHTKLACNHARMSFSEAVEVLAPYAAHLHLVDAAGLDEEGLQILEGEVDWYTFAEQIRRIAPSIGFIPEIWQGHVDRGQGFWTALERLEGIL